LDYNQKLIRSFGRTKSRKLSNHKNSLLENFYESYKISEIDNANSKNFLEIGFGFGDFIFGKAKQNPDANFYGCEPHLNGIVNLLSMLKKEPLSNLKITNQDVRIFIDN
jgi:tRNA G46 methylase TrmB